MRKTTTIALLAAAGLTITGCAKGIDDITPDMTLAERDEIYVDYLVEKYGEDYPDMPAHEAPAMAQAICTAYDTGLGDLALLGIYADIPTESMGIARDIINTGIKVYCPEHHGEEA